jgi:hypothetical protein
MLYVALPPLTTLLAVALMSLPKIRGGSIALMSILLSLFVLHIGVCAGYVHVAKNGLVASRLPLHSNMQKTTTTKHTESISASPTQDAIAVWLCAQAGTLALHGDLAATQDIGLGLQQFFHCRNRTVLATAGGVDNAWTGLPLPVWREHFVAPTLVLGSYGLSQAAAVISPKAAMPQVYGRAYPPRFTQMIVAANHGLWQVQFQSKPGAWVVVSSLLPTYPLFSVNADADGVAQQALTRFANTSVYACDGCVESSTNWNISVAGGAPESTSITVLYPKPEPSGSSRLR